MRLRNLCLLLTALPLAATPAAFASTVTYAVWNAPTTISPTAGVETGTIGGINVTYTGEINFVDQSNAGQFNYFQPVGTYVGGVVGNAPTDGGMIAITGAPGVTNTFTFSAPVSGIVFDFVSLGNSGAPTDYTFNQSFSIVACGPNIIYGGSCIQQSGNEIFTPESDGTIVFSGGPVTSFSFTAQNPEYWNGFTIGLLPQTDSPVPEPGTLAMVGTGIAGLLGAAKRKLSA